MLKPYAPWSVVIFALFCETNAYKLLLVSPLPGKSHAILADAMVELLNSAGHEVNNVSLFKENTKIALGSKFKIKMNTLSNFLGCSRILRLMFFYFHR